jgi:hypothetical protein
MANASSSDKPGVTKGCWKHLLKILDNNTIHVNNEFISCEHNETSLVDELMG